MLPAICIVSELPPPPGGIAVQARILGENLRREGHAVFNAPTNPLAHESAVRGVKGLRGIVNFLLYLPRLWGASRRADCLHIFSHSYLSFFLFTMPAVAAGRLLGKRIILHYHGGAAEDFLQRWFWAAGPIFRAAHRVVVPSDFLAEVFRRFGMATEQVPNVLELRDFPFRPRVPLRPRVIMSRHLEPVYNVACGLRAFAALYRSFPDATMIVAGDGRERAALEALSRELGIEGRVRFTGNVVNEQMRALYEESDIYLNSSRVDNQPVSVLEAFACGLPVVSTAVGGIPHMTRDGLDALLAPDDDAEALADNMTRLLSEPELVQRIVHRAKTRIGDYSWESVYRKHRALYGERS